MRLEPRLPSGCTVARVALLLASAIGLNGAPALAQGNPGATPLGGRSTLAGGTGVALGRDGAAPFLNPATISGIADTKVAFSVHAYQLSLTQLPDFYRPLPGRPEYADSSIVRRKFSTVPSTFCAFVALTRIIPEESSGLLARVRGYSGRTKLGICGATIERDSFELSAEGLSQVRRDATSSVAYDVRRTWRRFSIGPSLSYQITDQLTVGASSHVVVTGARSSWDINSLALDEAGAAFTSYSENMRGDSVDGSTIVGVTYAYRRQTFGLSARLPAVHFWGNARATRFVTAPNADAELALSTGSFKAPPRPNVALGTGVEWDMCTLEVDAIHTLGAPNSIETHLATTAYDRGSPQGRARDTVARERTRAITSFRLGAQWSVSPTLSLIGGARVDPSATHGPLARAPARFLQARTHQVAGSLGIGSSATGTELLIGGQLTHGWGKMLLLTPTHSGVDRSVMDTKTFTFVLVLSGSVNLRSITRAVEDLGELGW